MSKKRLLILGGLLGVLVLGSFGVRAWGGFAQYGEARTIGQKAAGFKDLSNRFTALAQEKGASYAFEVLKRAILPPNTDMHLLGHTVGDVLYEHKGIEGIADCTQDFRNACSHAVVTGALLEHGPGDSTRRAIDAACRQAPGGLGAYTMCYHGLGHGVFAYFGYDLEKTVAFCEQTGTKDYAEQQFTQCVSGAIMELGSGGGHDRESWMRAREKYFSSHNQLSPCMTRIIPEQAEALCLLYITPHLFELAGADLGRPDPALFPTAFSFCDAISKQKKSLRGWCFAGFGKEFVALAGERDIRDVTRYSDIQYNRVIEWCALAEAADGRDACVAEAVGSILWGGENDPEASFRFCSLVSDASMQGACYHELAQNIARYLPDRIDLCLRLPEKERLVCEK